MNDALHDDAERLRRRQGEADADATRTPPPSGRGAPCVVASVASAGTDTGPKVYRMDALILTGTEIEGEDGVLTGAGWSFFAVNIGAGIPSSGTNVLATFVDFRWVFSSS